MARSRFMVSPASVMAFLMRNVDLSRFTLEVTKISPREHHFKIIDKQTQEVVFSLTWNSSVRDRVTLPLQLLAA